MANTASRNQNRPQQSGPRLTASTPDGAPKKKALYLGVSSARADRLHPGFSLEEWDWVRADPDPSVKPDIQTFLHELKEIAPASMEAVWAPHVLHRLYPHIVEAMLQKAYRALKDEGVLIISVPDAQLAATYLANNQPAEVLYKSPAGEVTAHDVLFGFAKNIERGMHQFAHRTGFTCESLGAALRNAGFSSIAIRSEEFDLHAVAHRFDYDNPRRVEKISILYPKAGEKGRPKPPESPQTTVAAAPATANNLALDNLDQPPLLWKPLGLGLK